MPDRDEIALRLFGAAHARADTAGVHFGDGADAVIRDMSAKAATEILRQAAATGVAPDALVRNGEVVFASLVDEMIAARQRIPGYVAARADAIGEQTLAEALQRLCPIWPIC